MLHDKKMEKGSPIDVHIFDVKCCFDEVWPADAINVLFELGVKNDNLCILNEETKKALVSVNTSVGKTERFEVNDLLCQGSSWGPLKTSATVDTVGKDEEKSGENSYEYKESVKIPPLSFVDDILALSKCGVKSVILNAIINAKIQTKKLRFGPTKCHLMHVGSANPHCPELQVLSLIHI